MKLNKLDLKRIQLKKQFLTFEKENLSMTTILQKLQYVQLDTLNVANARSQDIFFRSRIDTYQKNDYLTLYCMGFQEVYLHALSLVPSNSIIVPLFHQIGSTRLKNELDEEIYELFFKETSNKNHLKKLTYLEKRKSSGWNLTNEGKFINLLWRSGKINIHRDENFKKIFNLASPINQTDSFNKEKLRNLWVKQLILIAFENIGIATFNDIKNYFGLKNKEMTPIFNSLLQEKVICSLDNSGTEELFILLTDLPYLDKEIKREIFPSCTFLSPFDNLIRERKRLANIFNFDYILESYIKKEKRIYGYYALPILINEDIVGTIDLKFNRKENVLYIEKLILNENYSKYKHAEIILEELKSFTKFIKADTYHFANSSIKNAFGI